MLRERGMREKRPLLYDEVSLRKIKENLPVTRWNLKRISMFAESISDKQPAPEEEPKAPISIVHPPQNNLSHANIPSHLLSQNILTMSPGLLGSPLPATQFRYDAGSMERRALMSSESREKFLGNSRLITPSDGYNPFQPEPWTATSESKFHAEQNRAGNPFGASMEKLTIATPPKIEENHHMQAKDLVNSAAIHQLSDPDTNDETEREHSSDIPPDIPSPGSKSKKSDTGSRISNILSSKGKEKKAMPRDSPGFLVRTLDTAARRAGDNGFFSKDTPQGLRPLKDDYLERIQKEDSFRWQTKRFEALGEGIHRHCLREIRRQELLPPLLPKTTSGGNKKSNYDLEQLIPSFARIEDDILAVSDSLGKAASGDPLFEKYGELNEFITHSKTRCVRIAHKIDPCGFGVEILYVVKQGWDNSRETRKRYQKRLTSEFRISSALNHPNVLRSLDLLQDSRGVYSMVTKYCAAGNLHTLISTTGELESGESDCFFKQLVCGLRYIHEMGVAHRDLNPENLLLTTEGTLKIASFGSSESFRVSNGEEVRLSSGLCGSGPYIAPEEYTEKEFSSSAADIWATGLIYMAMRTGQSLWKVSGQDDRLFRQYTKNRRYSEGYPPIETLHQVSSWLDQFNIEVYAIFD
jgi:protein-serine/threonine kinase